MQSRAETMVYVHTNLRLIYRQRKEWLRGKIKMWDVFPDGMGLDSNVELTLANMDLNDPVLEPVRFDDSDILEGSSSTPVDAEATMDTREERRMQRRAVVTMMMRTLMLILMMTLRIDDYLLP